MKKEMSIKKCSRQYEIFVVLSVHKMVKVTLLWEKLKRNQTILTNLSYLGILQVFIILCPLITYPYLLRVIGTELYGRVIFAQTLITYVSLMINFGFNISAVKSIAIHKADRQKLSEIVSSVYTSKFVLWLACLVTYLSLISVISFFKSHFLLYFFSFFVTINELLFPVWFFQGMEKMRYTTFINVTVRSFFVIATFIIIKSQSDYLYIPLLNSIGAVIASIISTYILFKKEHIRFLLLPVRKIYRHFKESAPLFVSIISSQIYTNLNKLIAGAFLGMSEVSMYDLGEKILLILKVQISMIDQAVFPKISREKDIAFVNKVMFISFGITIIESLFFYWKNEWIVIFFMGKYTEEVSTIISILLSSSIFIVFRSSMAVCRLICFGHYKIYMQIVLLGFLFYFCAVCVLFIFNMISLRVLALLAVGVELFICCLLLYHNNKLHLLYTKKLNIKRLKNRFN